MIATSLELLKKHVRADDFADDDAYLMHLLQTATAAVVRHTGRTVAELTAMAGGDVAAVPADTAIGDREPVLLPLELTHAVLLLAGHWYNQREAVSPSQMYAVPGTLQILVKPFMKLT